MPYPPAIPKKLSGWLPASKRAQLDLRYSRLDLYPASGISEPKTWSASSSSSCSSQSLATSSYQIPHHHSLIICISDHQLSF